jgi:hypothetical protein
LSGAALFDKMDGMPADNGTGNIKVQFAATMRCVFFRKTARAAPAFISEASVGQPLSPVSAVHAALTAPVANAACNA